MVYGIVKYSLLRELIRKIWHSNSWWAHIPWRVHVWSAYLWGMFILDFLIAAGVVPTGPGLYSSAWSKARPQSQEWYIAVLYFVERRFYSSFEIVD